MHELETAKQAAIQGGEIITKYFQEGVAIRSKDTSNLVSDADVDSERKIVEVIQDTFPGHSVLCEEEHQDDAGAEHLWVIDPLDGTNNFSHGLPHFAVSIGYYRAGVAQCGVIYNPIRNDWYEVTRGRGSFHNGRQVHVNSNQQLNEVLVGVGFYYDRGKKMEATLDAVRELFHQHIHGIRRFGTAALDFVEVGTGNYGAFFEYQLSPWDFAVGRLFVEEAGGKVTTCTGEPLPLEQTTVLATNGHLHEAMLEVVHKHRP